MSNQDNLNKTYPILQFFESGHLPYELREISESCSWLAIAVADMLPPSAEVSAGLRKLLEAKDCFVRAKVAAQKDGG